MKNKWTDTFIEGIAIIIFIISLSMIFQDFDNTSIVTIGVLGFFTSILLLGISRLIELIKTTNLYLNSIYKTIPKKEDTKENQ